MKSIILIISLINLQYESFQENQLIDHYVRFHNLETCDFTVSSNDESFDIYYKNDLMMNVTRKNITIYLSDFDFVKNDELNSFLHFFIYDYIFSPEYIHLYYSGTDENFESFENFIDKNNYNYGSSIKGYSYYVNEENNDTKIWAPHSALNNNQIIKLIEGILSEYNMN